MKRLSFPAFDRARQFMKTEARPLDRATFEYRFEGGPAEAVIDELARFQNPDGGFGRALEPDLRTPTSSALATGIALRLMEELDLPADNPMVRQAVSYLHATFNPDEFVWRVTPEDANAFPHAPWWHDEDGSLSRTFDGFRIIPRAELVGLLHHYSELVPGGWLHELTERTVGDIEDIAALGTGGGDDLVYALHLAETGDLPATFRDRLLKRIRLGVPKAVSRDPQEWAGYSIHPLKVAPSPHSPVADLIWDALQLDLDYQIDHQTPEGTWDPVWTWGDSYLEAWEQAKQEWRGFLTLDTLTTLRDFGRIEA